MVVDVAKRGASGVVSRWGCPTCGEKAVKSSGRWVIAHAAGCAEYAGQEDVGPVTALNDPDNAYLVKDD